MTNSDARPPDYPTVDFVIGAIVDWVNKYRTFVGLAALGRCTPEDVRQIAHELGMSPGELRELATKGPNSADLLGKMLAALKVDPNELSKENIAVMRDLQRLCVSCDHKGRCRRELAAGTAAEHFHEFCPNAFTLDALLKRESLPFKH